MVKTLHSQCREHGFNPWLGNYVSTWCAAKTIFLNVKNQKFKFNQKCGLEISGKEGYQWVSQGVRWPNIHTLSPYWAPPKYKAPIHLSGIESHWQKMAKSSPYKPRTHKSVFHYAGFHTQNSSWSHPSGPLSVQLHELCLQQWRWACPCQPQSHTWDTVSVKMTSEAKDAAWEKCLNSTANLVKF